MNNSDWLYEMKGKVHGPISFRQLKVLADTNRLQPTDLVWHAGDSRKYAANRIDGLFGEPVSQQNSEPEPSALSLAPSITEHGQISLVCTGCGFQFKVAEGFVGRGGRCPIPSCGKSFVVPEPLLTPADEASDLIHWDDERSVLPELSVVEPSRRRKVARLVAKSDSSPLTPSKLDIAFLVRRLRSIDQPSFVIGLIAAGLCAFFAVAIWPWHSSRSISTQDQSVSARSTTQEAIHPRRQFLDVLPILQKHCTKCHAGDDAQGGFSLADYRDEQSILKHRRTWERLTNLISMGAMPPAGSPQLVANDKEKLLDYLDSALFQIDCSKVSDPGRVTIRRLNRFEYNNTIRDLLGINFQPADDFPSDDVGNGFDNIGEILSLSPLLMEKYLIAAEKIAATAITSSSQRSANLPEPLRQLIAHHPRDGKRSIDCIHENIRQFVPRAFHRPVASDELNIFVSLAEQATQRGESFEFSMQTALTAILVSPQFLFRLESNEQPIKSQDTRELNDFELATRLSYFLWSSIPDDELLQRATHGDLHTDAVLDAQVRRMLQDWKSSALTEGFATQWLNLRILDECRPDPVKFKEFSTAIKEDLKQETKSFFEYVIHRDRSILEFLDGPYTFVNNRLANYYGLPDVSGDQFRMVSLQNEPRAGLLTQGSILTLTSMPTRTSPVKRGKWILEAILDEPPLQPPPNVPDLGQTSMESPELSLRQQLELHRSNPNCTSCHQTMDALGFGMESFDAIGRWRASDGKHLLDTTGALPSGKTFHGPKELIALLKQRDCDFAKALTSKLLTYALGRRLEVYDRCTVDSIVKALKANEFKFSVVVCEIVKSRPFRMRRCEGVEL